MRNRLTSIVLAVALAATAAFAAEEPKKAAEPLKLKVGDMAPDFTLRSTAGGNVKLSDFRGKNMVVLAFYPAAFTGG